MEHGKSDLLPVWVMSGTLNFFGEGYPFHKLYKKLFGSRFTFEGVMFVAKTTTLRYQPGNMPLKEDGVTPKEYRPACIILGWWQFLWGVMLNAVGLSGLGTQALLEKGPWQKRSEPFMPSFMPIEKHEDKELGISLRRKEFRDFILLLAKHLDEFRAKIFLQINVTCPNVKGEHKSDELLLREGLGYLALLALHAPGVKVFFKLNIFVSPKVATQLSKHPQCAGVCITNTLPWATLTRWQQILYFPWSLFTGESPLHRFGGGGLSGRPLLVLVEKWVREARQAGFRKHINAGGGIFCTDDVNRLRNAGADSVSIGSVVALRPWRLRGIVKRAYTIFPL